MAQASVVAHIRTLTTAFSCSTSGFLLPSSSDSPIEPTREAYDARILRAPQHQQNRLVDDSVFARFTAQLRGRNGSLGEPLRPMLDRPFTTSPR